jgi:hypothetical protein
VPDAPIGGAFGANYGIGCPISADVGQQPDPPKPDPPKPDPSKLDQLGSNLNEGEYGLENKQDNQGANCGWTS